MLFLRMKNFIRILFFVFAAVATGCTKNEFYLEFSLPEEITHNYSVNYYGSSKKGGFLVQATAPVQKGKYELRCVTVLPTLVYISSASHPEGIVVYAKRGEKIKITGTSANPAAWTADGNNINKRLSAWRKENADILEKGNKEEINAAVAAFVRENPSDPVSTILMETTFSRRLSPKGYLSLWNSLQGNAKERQWINLIGRADQLTPSVEWPAILKSLYMRSAGNGIDTIITSKTNATLLFFWINAIDNRNVYFDSLQNLTKEFPDSVSRIIADVSLEPDSLSWRNFIRKDTIDKIVRFWAPQGLADSRLIKLGVPDYPYFIVYDKEGNPMYRGKETSEAFKTFRTLMKTD